MDLIDKITTKCEFCRETITIENKHVAVHCPACGEFIAPCAICAGHDDLIKECPANKMAKKLMDAIDRHNKQIEKCYVSYSEASNLDFQKCKSCGLESAKKPDEPCPGCEMLRDHATEMGLTLIEAHKSLPGVEDYINHPNHYLKGIEAIEIIESWELDFYIGNVVKYILRAPHKGKELEDLKKARWYLERKISKLEEEE